MLNDSFELFVKKLGKTFKLQKELLKTEMDHDEVDYNNYQDKKKMNGYLMLKMTFVLLLVMLGFVKQWKRLQNLR